MWFRRIVRRSLATGFLGACLLCSAPPSEAQTRSAAPAAGAYKLPRTPDGQPDLQGYWTNLTYTPFERPKALGTKAFYKIGRAHV